MQFIFIDQRRKIVLNGLCKEELGGNGYEI